MSDDAKCDYCGKPGRRPRMHFAPKGWLYLEAYDSEEDPRREHSIIVAVCSAECAARLWKNGPGERLDAKPSPEEIEMPQEVDLTGYVSEQKLLSIEFIGKAVKQPDGLYLVLANVAGALCRVEVRLTPTQQVDYVSKVHI